MFGNGSVNRLCCAWLVAKNTQLAGSEVIKHININGAVAFIVRGGEYCTGLRIALSGNAVSDFPFVQINYGNVVSGIHTELRNARNADIRSAVINCRCAGAHRRITKRIVTVIKFNIFKSVFKNIACCFVDFNGVEVTAFGSEIELAAIVGYAASDIANIGHND